MNQSVWLPSEEKNTPFGKALDSIIKSLGVADFLLKLRTIRTCKDNIEHLKPQIENSTTIGIGTVNKAAKNTTLEGLITNEKSSKVL
jgi:hypothetical protein